MGEGARDSSRRFGLDLFKPAGRADNSVVALIGTMGQTVFPSMATQISTAGSGQTAYNPLGSVWEGDDAELLERMLAFYPRKRPKRILDATVNGGRFWRDSKRPVYGLDLDIAQRPQIVADNTQMPFTRSEEHTAEPQALRHLVC